jgi:hypothetical protein
MCNAKRHHCLVAHIIWVNRNARITRNHKMHKWLKLYPSGQYAIWNCVCKVTLQTSLAQKSISCTEYNIFWKDSKVIDLCAGFLLLLANIILNTIRASIVIIYYFDIKSHPITNLISARRCWMSSNVLAYSRMALMSTPKYLISSEEIQWFCLID